MKLNTTAVAAFQLTKAGNIDPNPMTIKGKSASSLSVAPDGTTFVTTRDDGGLHHLTVLPDTGDASRVAFGLAQAISARSESCDTPNLAEARAIASLEYDRGTVIGNNTQAGSDIAMVVEAVAGALQPGEWVAFAVRRPRKVEMRRYKRWTDHRRVGMHHSLEAGAVLTAMWAGGHSTASARSLLKRVSGSLPGFDLRTKTRILARTGTGLVYWAAAVVAGGIGYLLNDWRGWTAAGIAVCAAVLTIAGRLPSRGKRIRNLLFRGLVPAPPASLIPPSRPRAAGTDSKGNAVAENAGDYPFTPGAFLLGAVLPLSIIAPHSGADSGVTSTKTRIAPPVLRDRVGPFIGTSQGAPVYLADWDRWQGLFCVGQAGSGKSAFLQALWGYDALAKSASQHTMIALDTKGDGLSSREYSDWARSAAIPFTRIDFADEKSQLGIELFPTTGSAVNRARRVVSALKYVFGEVSIGAESFDTLTRVMTAACTVSDDLAAQVDGVESGKSPFYYANILLSNRGDDLGKDLAAAITDRASREAAGVGTDIYDAAEMLRPIYDPHRTVAQRAQLLKAPRTKVAPLMAAEHWWSRPRRATWEQILTQHAAIIINTGKSQNGYMADKELVAQMSALIMYSLHEEIQRCCDGWFEAGRGVSIYADELKHIAGSSADVVSWIRNDARSFGVRAVFATQYPEQLEPQVRDAVMGFGTLIAYAQQNPTVCETIVRTISIDGSAWTTADVSGLPQYEAIVRTQFRQTAQAAFTVAIPDFRSQRGPEFAAVQGFAS